MMIMYALRAVRIVSRLSRGVGFQRDGGAVLRQSAGVCRVCHPVRGRGRITWMHHVAYVDSTLEMASSCGFVQLTCSTRLHEPVPAGQRAAPAAGRACDWRVVRSCPRAKSAGRSARPRACRARCPDGRCGSVQTRVPPRPPRQHSRPDSTRTPGERPSRRGNARQADADRTDRMYSTGNRTPLSARNTQSRMAPIMPHGPRSRLRPILHASKWARFQTWTIRTVM